MAEYRSGMIVKRQPLLWPAKDMARLKVTIGYPIKANGT